MPTTIKSSNIPTGTVTADDLASTLDISGKTVTLPETSVTSHAPAFDDNQIKEDIALLAFKQATSDSLVKYDLVDQTIDVFTDASGINAGSSVNENRDSSGKYYVGSVSASGNATGGTESTHGSYKVHTFLTGDNFIAPSSGNVSVLVVAGGGASVGAGTQAHSAGGGAGGMRTSATHAVTAQTYPVTVGAGGTPLSYGSVVDATMEGDDSIFDTITSTGGGRGGQGYTGTSAAQA